MATNNSKKQLNLELSIQVSLDGLSFCVLDTVGQSIALRHEHRFDSAVTPYRLQHELKERQKEMDKYHSTKKEIAWGSQIRSYVLDQSRIKDLRTGVETGNTQAVLDGGLDAFIEASLKSGL